MKRSPTCEAVRKRHRHRLTRPRCN
ncbi:hypothetical protein RHECNPAF_1330056 [Rhizobium etli CNPAF512]|nr:hypothetical protein RHECNPAF_1330056 [Rhizobium etli CNPAF512]